MVDTLFLTATIVALVAGWAAKHIYQMGQDMTARLVDAEKRIGQLEQAQVKHVPYRTADEIENSIAAMLRLKNELDFKVELFDNALSHLRQARNPKK